LHRRLGDAGPKRDAASVWLHRARIDLGLPALGV
jgi:hypothetical protein